MNLPDLYRGGGGGLPAGPGLAAIGGESASADRLDLGFVWALFRRRLRLFLATFVIIFLFFVALIVWLPASYTATSQVVMNVQDQPVTPTPQTVATSDQPRTTSDIDTEVAVLESRDLAAKVVDELQLYRQPDLRSELLPHGPIGLVRRALGLVPPLPDPLPPETVAKLRNILINEVMANLDVERVATAYGVSLNYTDKSPERAAAIANAYAHLYVQSQVGMKQQQNQAAVDVLAPRIDTLRERAQQDFRALQQYRIANNLQSTTGASLTEQEISAYNQQVASARAAAAEDQARLETARAQLRNGSSGDDVGEALSSPVVHALRSQRSILSAKVADYSSRYGPKNPDLLDAKSQLADTDAQIQAEINRVISNLEARAKVSQERVASLLQSLGAARGTLSQDNHAMIGLDDLQRRADTSQALYQTYLDRYKTAVAQLGAEQPASRLISDAIVPGAPSSPKVILLLALGLVLGLGAGVALALLVEALFTGLTTGEDVERRLGVTYLGGIPLLSSVSLRGTTPLDAVIDNSRSAFAEAFRNVLNATCQAGGDRIQVVLISSALPDEGKTTTTACLAQAAVSMGLNAIVVDCDTVKRQYSERYTNADRRRPGLREVLRGEELIEDAIIHSNSGTLVLPITEPFNDEDDGLDRGAIRALVAQLRERYDLIILDSAPILPVVEARELAEVADRIVLLASWRKTPDKALINAIRTLPAEVRHRIGVVLTMIDIKRQEQFGPGDTFAYYRSYKTYYKA